MILVKVGNIAMGGKKLKSWWIYISKIQQYPIFFFPFFFFFWAKENQGLWICDQNAEIILTVFPI